MNTATAARLADIYARSLLDLTKESRTVEAIAADLEAVSTLLAQQPGLEAFLAFAHVDHLIVFVFQIGLGASPDVFFIVNNENSPSSISHAQVPPPGVR